MKQQRGLILVFPLLFLVGGGACFQARAQELESQSQNGNPDVSINFWGEVMAYLRLAIRLLQSEGFSPWNRSRLARPLLVASLAGSVLMAVPGLLQASPLPMCTNPISKCGCAIYSPGSYSTSGPLTGSSGDCIDVEASNVELLTSSLTGPGTKNSVGIRIDGAGAAVATFVSNFGTGIIINAPRTILFGSLIGPNVGDGLVIQAGQIYLQGNLIQNNGGRGVVDYAPSRFISQGDLSQDNGGNGFEFDGPATIGSLFGKPANAPVGGVLLNGTAANSNGGNGFSFSNVSGIMLTFVFSVQSGPLEDDFAAPAANDNHLDGFQFINVSGISGNGSSAASNGKYGYEVRASGLNSFLATAASSNGASGIYLGCVDAFGKCLTPGGGNALFSISADDNAEYGIEVEYGESGDQFLFNQASGNTVGDAIDHNPNCGTNHWVDNSFAANATPACVNASPVP